MSKLSYLNLGCGNKYHEEWVNVDMGGSSPNVRSHNLLKGIPFPNDQFDVVYHSQVLEHFSKEKAPEFVKECFRVLKPNGIVRVVVPDLEGIANEYLKHLHVNIVNPSKESEANYDWILLEMYDQVVRARSGGQMADFLRQSELINEKFVFDRVGYVGKAIRDKHLDNERSAYGLLGFIKNARRAGLRKILGRIFLEINNVIHSKEKKLGAFRMGGEVHLWMYDRFSLSRLLRDAGFQDIEVKTPYESNVPQWGKYELDVKNGAVFDPSSLFMEARKPDYRKPQ